MARQTERQSGPLLRQQDPTVGPPARQQGWVDVSSHYGYG